MRFGIVVFPGTWSDTDCYYAVGDVLGQQASYVWHQESDLSRYDCIILPGGFSYGDYLRAGAIAKFSPVMTAVRERVGSDDELRKGQRNCSYHNWYAKAPAPAKPASVTTINPQPAW